MLRELKVSEVAEGRRELGIDPLVIHAIYLINLASEDRGLVERSVQSLIAALEAGAVLGARAVITHVGSHGGRGFEAVAAQVAAALRRAADSAAGGVELLLENSAGTGGIIGSRIEELSALLSLAGGHQRLGIALDTAHLCAAGWDFAGDPGAARRLTAEVDYLIGMDRLRIVHANDSNLPPGSRRDRHANVGDGFIGLVGFRSLLAEPRLTGVPWILETPDLDSRLDDSQRFISLRRLQALAQEHAAAVG